MSEEKDTLPGDVSGNNTVARASAAGKRTGRKAGTSASPRKTTSVKTAGKDAGEDASAEKPAARSRTAAAKTKAPAAGEAAGAKTKTAATKAASAGKKTAAKKTLRESVDATAQSGTETPAESLEKAAKTPAARTRKSAAPKAAASAVAKDAGDDAATAGAKTGKSAGRKTSAKKASTPDEGSGSAPEQIPTPSAPEQSGVSSLTAAPEKASTAKKTATRSAAAKSSRSRGRTAAVMVEAAPHVEDSFVPEGNFAFAPEQQEAGIARETQGIAVEVPAVSDAGEAQGVSSATDAAPAAQGEKRRRSRSRRGRGRKKAAMANGDAAEVLADAGVEGSDSPTEVPDPADGGDDAASVMNSGEDAESTRPVTARRKMFVSVQPEEQVEVVLTEEGQVQEYYVEMLHQAKTKGNIYKAVIHNVDPNLQAAFVSYGAVKNGFLQIDEVHPEYYITTHEPGKGRKYPPIQKVLKAGQELLVQVVKEPAGTKGAFLTTYLSLPGRFLVLTPGREQIGVSRKVEQDEERSRLRELLEGLNPGPGLGVIVRTVSMGASKTSLQRDLQNLKKLWKEVRARGTSETPPSLIYQEMDLATRAVRDYLTEQVAEVWLDDEKTAKEIADLSEILFPRKKNLVRIHADTSSTLFERFNLQRQLDQIHSREVSLPSGGRLVFDITEALTAIDINSGRSGGKNNFEDMAYRTNMEAAKMIPLQLRLRDIGGQIVADFIEMRDRNHWRDVEKTLRAGMKIDRARYDVGKIGPFGLLEIVRQRLGSSAISVSSEPCPHCKGTGVRRNMEWQSQQALRELQRQMRAVQGQENASVIYEVEPLLALHLLNSKRQRLVEMEQSFGVTLEIRPALGVSGS